MTIPPVISLGIPPIADLLARPAVPPAAEAACAQMAALAPRIRLAIAAHIASDDGRLMASLPGFSDGPGAIRYNGAHPREDTAHARMAAAAVDGPLTEALTRWRDAIGARWVYARMDRNGPLIVEAKPDNISDDWEVAAPPEEVSQRLLLLRALQMPPRSQPRHWACEVTLEGTTQKQDRWRLTGATLGDALRHARLIAIAWALSDAREAVREVTVQSICRYVEAADVAAALAAEPFPPVVA